MQNPSDIFGDILAVMSVLFVIFLIGFKAVDMYLGNKQHTAWKREYEKEEARLKK
ncbi:MAG: hypothetical protein U9O94_10655 [Nanoarchaeota archaeon]|nr:hypothetical protein [Nanoarchaeota archaeon]